jgi:hypothetical protein
VQDVVADPSEERAVRVEAQLARLRTQLLLVRPGPRDDEADVARAGAPAA